MPARLTVHPPERASQFFVVPEEASRVLGRDPACDIVLDDPRVSKRHASLLWADEGWTLEDLDSKNGTLINGRPAGGYVRHGDWISLGGVNAEFARLSSAELVAIERDGNRRRETSIIRRRECTPEQGAAVLLRRLLRSSIELTGTERGFVLLLDRFGRLQAEVASGFRAEAEAAAIFDGSRSVLERVRETGKTVVITDAQADARLSGQPSIGLAGLRGLASVPLRMNGSLRGFLYVDGRRPGTTISQLDVEILEGLAEQAAIVLASVEIDRQIRDLLDPLDGERPS
jgi:hypothetical protein